MTHLPARGALSSERGDINNKEKAQQRPVDVFSSRKGRGRGAPVELWLVFLQEALVHAVPLVHLEVILFVCGRSRMN